MRRTTPHVPQKLTIHPGDDDGLEAGDEEQVCSTGAVRVDQLKQVESTLSQKQTHINTQCAL